MTTVGVEPRSCDQGRRKATPLPFRPPCRQVKVSSVTEESLLLHFAKQPQYAFPISEIQNMRFRYFKNYKGFFLQFATLFEENDWKQKVVSMPIHRIT